MPHHSELDRHRAAVEVYLAQWRTLTTAEGEAIRADRWQDVERLQATKQQLQMFLNGAVEELRAAARVAGLEPDEVVRAFHDEVTRLVEQESANGHTLTVARQKAQAARQELESATQQLRQVRHAYAPPPAAQWQSYS